jgi:hypothetical protein
MASSGSAETDAIPPGAIIITSKSINRKRTTFFTPRLLQSHEPSAQKHHHRRSNDKVKGELTQNRDRQISANQADDEQQQSRVPQSAPGPVKLDFHLFSSLDKQL